MPLYDPGDCAYHVNANNVGVNNKQSLGSIIVGSPGLGTSYQVLTTARKFGPGATGVYLKYNHRMETDSISVIVA